MNLHTALQAIQHGGVIAYPTEAVYGLGCDPQNLQAVQRILDIKQRPAHKGLILIAADWAQVQAYLLPITPAIMARISAPTAHPTTWLLPVNPNVSPLIRGAHHTLAVRITQHYWNRYKVQPVGRVNRPRPITREEPRAWDTPHAAREREQLRKVEKAMDGVGWTALVIAGLIATLVIIMQVGKWFYGW